MREGLLLGRFLLPIIAAASRRGLDPLRWQRLGIEAHRLTALDTMVPSSRLYRFLEELAPRCDIEELAIEVATSTSASDMGLGCRTDHPCLAPAAGERALHCSGGRRPGAR